MKDSLDTNIKNKESKNEDYYRVSISKEADNALVSIRDRVNKDFDGGRVNRTDLANWIISKFNEDLSDSDIREIRSEYFDEIAVLEAVFMRAKKGKQVPPELKTFLQKQIGLDDTPKKRKKSLQDNVINDYIAQEGA